MPGCFFFFFTDVSLAFQSQCSLWQGDEIILIINYKLYYLFGVFTELSVYVNWREGARAQWWIRKMRVWISHLTSVFILWEKLESICTRFHALYEHLSSFHHVYTLRALGLGNYYSSTSQKMKWKVTDCYIFYQERATNALGNTFFFYHGQCELQSLFYFSLNTMITFRPLKPPYWS